MKNDNKAKFLEKFDQPTKPVITQIVPVGEEVSKKTAPQIKAKDEPKDHFNVFLSKTVGKALRIHKINTGDSVQDILERIIVEYLVNKGELP